MLRLFALALASFACVQFGCAKPAIEATPNDNPAPVVREDAPQARLPVAPMPHLPRERFVIVTTAEKVAEVEEKDLTFPDPGLDSKIEAALPELNRLDQKTVDEKVTNDNIGLPSLTPGKVPPPPGLAPDKLEPGKEPKAGSTAFAGRTGATKEKLLKDHGGNEVSERAVALGLTWLARQQQEDGGWKFDAGKKDERAAATGMTLMAYLGAGFTHKKQKEKPKIDKGYDQVVSKGLDFLMKQCALTGGNAGRMSTDAYAHAIATIALCEAYAMTKDATLKPYAQAALNYIQRSQAANGSWGYGPGQQGDTSIVGWQIQALKAAMLSKDLVVDEKVIAKAIKFLDFSAAGARKSMYGYNDNTGAKPGTALTAAGLLSRYYISDWSPVHPGMVEGVSGLMKTPPVGKDELKNLYYYYYATQVVHFYEGEDWKTWNEGPKANDGTRKGGMRDWLVGQQIRKDGANLGSWDPEAGWFGKECGRLGTTAMSLLTLEVYYRYLPLYKRAADGEAPIIIGDK